MRMQRVVLLPGIIGVLLAVAACGSTKTLTTPSPAPAPASAPAPAPAPTTAGLQGTVASSAGAPINGARVTAIDGPNAGQSALTNVNGSYRFESLSIANMNFSATATDFLEQRAGTFVDGTNTLNFTLAPVPVPVPAPAPAPSTPSITITARITSGGTGALPQEWAFTATSSTTFTTYDWNFGDGRAATASGPNEQHVYRTKGNFTVTVTARQGSGSPVVGTLAITVQ